MTETLLPCPFCGGEARLLHLDYDDNRLWGVFCSNDLDAEYSHGHYIDNYATDAEAIEAWNTRAERTCENLVEEVDWTDYHDFECSECNASMRQNGNAPGGVFNYCPNCGAKVVDE